MNPAIITTFMFRLLPNDYEKCDRNHDNQYELSEYFKDYYTQEMFPFFPSSAHTANIYYTITVRNLIQKVPALRAFWDLEKTVLHEIRVSGTVL